MAERSRSICSRRARINGSPNRKPNELLHQLLDYEFFGNDCSMDTLVVRLCHSSAGANLCSDPSHSSDSLFSVDGATSNDRSAPKECLGVLSPAQSLRSCDHSGVLVG